MKDFLVKIYATASPPFPMSVMASCYNQSLKKSIGIEDSYKKFYYFLKKDKNVWVLFDSEIKRIPPKIIKKILEEPRIVDILKNNFLKKSKELLSLIEREKLKDISNYDDKKIKELLNKAIESYKETTYWIEPTKFSIDIDSSDTIKNMLQEFLLSKNIKFNSTEISQFMSVMLNPAEPSFAYKSELSLFNILMTDNEKETMIKEHVKKYYWLVHDYYGEIIDEKIVKKELELFKDLKKDEIKDKIKNLEAKQKKQKEDLSLAVKKYPLSKKFIDFFAVLRELNYVYSETKKEAVSKANIGFRIILEEIARRKNIDKYDIFFCTIEELNSIIDGKHHYFFFYINL